MMGKERKLKLDCILKDVPKNILLCGLLEHLRSQLMILIFLLLLRFIKIHLATVFFHLYSIIP